MPVNLGDSGSRWGSGRIGINLGIMYYFKYDATMARVRIFPPGVKRKGQESNKCKETHRLCGRLSMGWTRKKGEEF